MPKCIKCNDFFHPDYCIDVLPDDEKDTAKVCVFCKINKDKVTIEEENGEFVCEVKKTDAVNQYKKYVGELKESRKIAHLLKTGDRSRIIT